MSNDDDDDDDREHPPMPIGFAIPVNPAEILERHRAAHDRSDMAREALELELNHFLDGLTPAQLITLRAILNFDQKSVMNQYFDGQIVTLLRVVHHCNPDTGKKLDDGLHVLDEATAMEPPPPTDV